MLIALLFLLVWSGNIANATTTDSLVKVLRTHPQNDTSRVNLLIATAMAYVNSNVDSAVMFAGEGLSIAKKIDFNRGEARSLQVLGITSINKNEYNNALGYYNNALQITLKTGASNGTCLIYAHIGDVYARQGMHEQAVEYYEKSISLGREINDKATEGLSLMGMGNVYDDLGNFPEALKYNLDALRIFEAAHDSDALSTCQSNIATIYSSLGDFKRARDYNNQSLDIFERTGNKMGVLSATINLGVVYAEMKDYRGAIGIYNNGVALADSIGEKYFKTTLIANTGEAYYNLGSYDTAYDKYIIALKEAESLNDQANIAETQNGIGNILVKKGQIAEGIKHLLISYGIMQSAGMKEPIQEIAMNLSSAYEKAHDPISALKYYKVYAAYTDSLHNEKNDKRIQQLQFDYELEKKESEINLLQKDKIIAAAKSEKQTTIIWVSFSCMGLLIIFSILLYRSRSYEKRSKEEILRQKEEIQLQTVKLEELNRFKDRTFSVLSHDLRGPIDSFHSIISMLNGKMITDEEYLNLKPEMSSQIASLTILLDNLLKWASGFMKGQIGAKPVATNLYNLARQNINLTKNAAQKKQITISNQIPELLTAFCDTGQMDIVIRNLVMNAVKFTNHGGEVTITAAKDDRNIYLSIADNGVGMTKEQLDKLFLITTHNHTYGTDGEIGTGLGLLLCYEFIKENKGHISVTSEKDKGSVFTITLPA